VRAEAFEPVRARIAVEVGWNPRLCVVGTVCVAAGYPLVGFEIAGGVHVIGLGKDGLQGVQVRLEVVVGRTALGVGGVVTAVLLQPCVPVLRRAWLGRRRGRVHVGHFRRLYRRRAGA